jgi:hypothetical protein
MDSFLFLVKSIGDLDNQDNVVLALDKTRHVITVQMK